MECKTRRTWNGSSLLSTSLTFLMEGWIGEYDDDEDDDEHDEDNDIPYGQKRMRMIQPVTIMITQNWRIWFHEENEDDKTCDDNDNTGLENIVKTWTVAQMDMWRSTFRWLPTKHNRLKKQTHKTHATNKHTNKQKTKKQTNQKCVNLNDMHMLCTRAKRRSTSMTNTTTSFVVRSTFWCLAFIHQSKESQVTFEIVLHRKRKASTIHYHLHPHNFPTFKSPSSYS